MYRNVSSLFQEYKIKHFLVRDSCSSYITKLLIPSSPNTTPLSHAKKLMNHVPLPHAKGPPPNILSVPPPLRYITFGTSWSSANALQISHFHTAYVQSCSANKHCNTACVQSRSANKHRNTAYMQSRSANKHCNTAYMQSRSANSHGLFEYLFLLNKWRIVC